MSFFVVVMLCRVGTNGNGSEGDKKKETHLLLNASCVSNGRRNACAGLAYSYLFLFLFLAMQKSICSLVFFTPSIRYRLDFGANHRRNILCLRIDGKQTNVRAHMSSYVNALQVNRTNPNPNISSDHSFLFVSFTGFAWHHWHRVYLVNL